jgi:hypothetical protein
MRARPTFVEAVALREREHVLPDDQVIDQLDARDLTALNPARPGVALFAGSGASADEVRARMPELEIVTSRQGQGPFFLERPFAEAAIGSAQHELSLPNAMRELDASNRYGSFTFSILPRRSPKPTNSRVGRRTRAVVACDESVRQCEANESHGELPCVPVPTKRAR